VEGELKPFFVKDPAGKLRKVTPKSSQFWGKTGKERLEYETYVYGTLFDAGYYPFVFWGVPIFDRRGNEITKSGVSSDT
jgi:hypothetical protein